MKNSVECDKTGHVRSDRELLISITRSPRETGFKILNPLG